MPTATLVCYQLATICIAAVLVPYGFFFVCVCVNATENKSTCCSLAPLYTDVREKFLNDTSQNAVTASLESVLSWKNKTSLFRLANSVFSATRKRKEFTGSDQFFFFLMI